MVAVRAAGALYYTDHLGNVAAMSWAGGVYLPGSLARYDPFGNHRTLPGWSINPGISDRGFTGHVHDNTGAYPTQNIGLIYMNARYYLPEIGRFISVDTIVPEPGNPQSFNRYSYTLNSPLNYTDPTGHRETSGCDIRDCTQGGTVNPMTYRSADGSYSFADPYLSGQNLSPVGKKLTKIATANAYGVGVTASFSLDTPIAGIEFIAGREAIYVSESGATTQFIVIGGGIRVGPSKSFTSSLRKLVDGAIPVNVTISPSISAVNNVDNALEDYAGAFRYKSTTIAYESALLLQRRVSLAQSTSRPPAR